MLLSGSIQGYVCPICLGLQRVESANTLIRPTDIVFEDEFVTAFISPFFVGKNMGHVVIAPNNHYGNLYDLPQRIGHRIFDVSQELALAMKNAYDCSGITIRQNNELDGDQHVFHYHLHVFPRYKNDGYNTAQSSEKRLVSLIERANYARRLSAALTLD